MAVKLLTGGAFDFGTENLDTHKNQGYAKAKSQDRAVDKRDLQKPFATEVTELLARVFPFSFVFEKALKRVVERETQQECNGQHPE